MNDKIKAIVAHLTVIGWLIAVVLNLMTEKTPLTTFYLRQMLGLIILGFVLRWLPLMGLGLPISIALIALWGMSLYGAIKEEKRETPFIGKYFQEWFTFL